jgi:CheY-like chemotaxis protein
MALVLCTGIDPAVMTTRQLILEQAGHTVVLASNDRHVEKACKSHNFDVVVIGQNTSPAVKQRFVRIIREYCSLAKILELHRPFSDKALADADEWLAMPSDHPGALAEAVAELARKKNASEMGAG